MTNGGTHNDPVSLCSLALHLVMHTNERAHFLLNVGNTVFSETSEFLDEKSLRLCHQT